MYQGKSLLCSEYYKALYGLDKEIFSISDARLTFIKGLWIIKGKRKEKGEKLRIITLINFFSI